ncbi:erythromycin esterase family protein [Streptomyces sp. NPDC003998]
MDHRSGAHLPSGHTPPRPARRSDPRVPARRLTWPDDIFGSRTVWAHNGHVCTDRYARDIPAMGQHLREHYGEGYYALGLLFGEGAFRARPGNSATRPPRKHTISAAGPCSVEAQLASVTSEDHLIDLRAGRTEPAVAEWLESPQFMRSFGAGVPRVAYRFSMTQTLLMPEYDGLAYVARSTPSMLLS